MQAGRVLEALRHSDQNHLRRPGHAQLRLLSRPGAAAHSPTDPVGEEAKNMSACSLSKIHLAAKSTWLSVYDGIDYPGWPHIVGKRVSKTLVR